MNSSTNNPRIKLKAAIKEYQAMPGAVSNSYGWYRNSANKHGTVSIGDVDLKVFKTEGSWWLRTKDFERAVLLARKWRDRLIKNSEDLSRGIVHGKDGETIEFEGGRYTIHGSFRFETSYYELYRKRSEGSWHCNKCNDLAEIKGNTLICPRCGASRKGHRANGV